MPRDALIIGSGFAGVAAAVRLRAAGVQDIVVLERASAVGGTWRDNEYPGCACDVPSRLYSLSFAPNAEWTRSYSAQPEIRAYLERMAHDWGVMPLIRFDHTVQSARWDAASLRWHVDTNHGPFSASLVVMATGALSDAVLPDVPGHDAFRGAAFHSSQWDHTVPLHGKRVLVIGTGASAIQFVPRIQPTVATLTLFQRTPPWILPRHDRAYRCWELAAYQHVPGLEQLARGVIYASREATFLAFRDVRLARVVQRLAVRHLHRQVRDPALREVLTPNYALGCKRILVTNEYYPALTQSNVSVVTSGIQRIVHDGVVTADGVRHHGDVLIYGTGFRPTDPPLAPFVHGRDGQSLADAWGGSMHAHVGTTVHGFPNLFLVSGPNTGIGHTSQLYMIESQLQHVVSTMKYMRDHGVAATEPTAEAQQRWRHDVDARMQRMVWVAGGCRSWYLDATGRNSSLWPDFTFRFRQRVQYFEASAHHLTPETAA